MQRETLVDKTQTPDGTEVFLVEKGGTHTIRLGGAVLMNTRDHESEEKLAELACAAVPDFRRVLVGGLGFGFTLKAALAMAPRNATVVVAELLQAVIDWNLDPRFPFAARALRDPRVRLVHDDVYDVLDRERFDVILLDVDNDPKAFTTEANRRLYGGRGLEQTWRSLSPGGCVAYWSACQNPSFMKRMRAAGFETQLHRWWNHTIFLGLKRKSNPRASKPRPRGRTPFRR